MPVTWRGIVKVQRNIGGYNGPEKKAIAPGTMVRINNQTNSIIWSGPLDEKLDEWFDIDEHKFYAHAELRDTLIHIVRRAEPQAW